MRAIDNVRTPNLRHFQHWIRKITVPLALTGCFLLCASVMPWLKDPLGDVYCAWQLPIYIGWSSHVSFLNYGLLCLCCGLYVFLVNSSGWQPWKRYSKFVSSAKITRFVPLIPVTLFLFQYLCADISAIVILANHERQMLLIQQQFGYQGTIQLVTLNPLNLNISTLWERLQLLLNCISYGPLSLCFMAWLLSGYHCPQMPHPRSANSCNKRKLTVSCCIAVLLVLFARAPIGMVCEYAAKEALAAGNYKQALVLLDYARFFNPEFEQAPYYHREQGQAQYFQSPTQLTTDSRVYLAEVYRIQGDYLDAYQQLLAPWYVHPAVPWLVDELDSTLESSLALRRPLRGTTAYRLNADDISLPWLQTLSKIDPSNSYAIYVIGRIQYDLHNYQGCIADMSALLRANSKDNIRSSAYTYIALSETELGNYATARLLLFNAISLDPGYHNNTAREELSGLH